MIKGYTYDEFGNLTQDANNFLNEITFTGSVTDTSSGLQYMNARYYDPSTGRFLSQDSYSGNPYDPWTQHLYSYCGNNPTNMVDPTGHIYYDYGKDGKLGWQSSLPDDNDDDNIGVSSNGELTRRQDYCYYVDYYESINHPVGGNSKTVSEAYGYKKEFTSTYIAWCELDKYIVDKYSDYINSAPYNELKAAAGGGLTQAASNHFSNKYPKGSPEAKGITRAFWALYAYIAIMNYANAEVNKQELEIIKNAQKKKTGIVITHFELTGPRAGGPGARDSVSEWYSYPYIYPDKYLFGSK